MSVNDLQICVRIVVLPIGVLVIDFNFAFEQRHHLTTNRTDAVLQGVPFTVDVP